MDRYEEAVAEFLLEGDAAAQFALLALPPPSSPPPALAIGDSWHYLQRCLPMRFINEFLKDASAINGRQLLSQHFTGSSQVKEIKGQAGWTSLAACGLDSIEVRGSASGGRYWALELNLPYLFQPGDGHSITFHLDHTSQQWVQTVKKKDAQAYVCRQILAVAFILDPHGVRINYETAFKPASGGQFVVRGIPANGPFEVIQFYAGLVDENDRFVCELASGMTRKPTPEEVMQRHAKATNFAFSYAKRFAQNQYEKGHTDAEVIEVLHEWSLSKKFANNIVDPSVYNPPDVWNRLARLVKPGGLRDILRRSPEQITILQDKPLIFSVHRDGPPSASSVMAASGAMLTAVEPCCRSLLAAEADRGRAGGKNSYYSKPSAASGAMSTAVEANLPSPSTADSTLPSSLYIASLEATWFGVDASSESLKRHP